VFSKIEPSSQWGWSELLTNKANYLLEVLIWQNANMGAKKSKWTKKPEPFIPEFMKPKAKSEITKEATSFSTEEISLILAQPRG
jgi:hypothetical protein